MAFSRTFSGVPYQSFIGQISRKREAHKYLEVGVNTGEVLSSVAATAAVGVDPALNLTFEPTLNKTCAKLYRMTSDTFFRGGFESGFDLAFLDGMHLFEFLLRDFYNTERSCVKHALILLHDCMPFNAAIAARTMPVGAWTGDVWKVIPILEKYRPELKITLVDCYETGIACISNIDPKSTILEDNYFRIVDEYRATPNDGAALEEFYRGRNIASADDILSAFDHSLYFKI